MKTRRFKIGLSFSGEIRVFVEKVAHYLSLALGTESILYDGYYVAEFARPDLAFHLPPLYSEECDIIVVLFDNAYSVKEWCGLEWRAAYSIIKYADSKRVMLVDFGGTPPKGLFGLEGSVHASGRTELEIANLILERLAINANHSREYFSSVLADCLKSEGNATSAVSKPDPKDLLSTLQQDFFISRRDRVGKTRKRSLLELAKKADSSLRLNRFGFEMRLTIWRQLLLESRYLLEYMTALSGIRDIFETALAMELPNNDRHQMYLLFAETAVDISQTAPPGVELNKLVARLNQSISYLGSEIGAGHNRLNAGRNFSELLIARSKCRRALSSLYRRRASGDNKLARLAETLRADSLTDAEAAYSQEPTDMATLELALSLFATSGTFHSETAERGLSLLTALASSGRSVLAAYELTHQLRMRHRHAEAIEAFRPLANTDDDRRRFHANLTHFAAAILGLYYDDRASEVVRAATVDACNWLQECISFEHHRAKEVVDLCFMRATAGLSADSFTEPLKEFKADSTAAWTELAKMAYSAASGEETLREALLLGLEDATIWNRIGTLYADFSGNYPKAIEFYDRAILISPRSPVFHFNKAKALVAGPKDYGAARHSLSQTRAQKGNLWSWYKINQPHIDALKQVIDANLPN